MDKRIKKIIFAIICIFSFNFVTKAYTYSITPSTTVTVGSTVRITLKTEDVMGFYRIYSENSSILSGGDEGSIDSPDYFTKEVVFRANNVGTVNIVVAPTSSGLNIYSSEEKLYAKSATIRVVPKSTNSNSTIDINRTYNKNNYLKGLSIDGYTLTPEFNKDTLEYSVTLEPGTENININAVVEDKTARVKGAGEVGVTEGTNTLNVIVTAENGNERTYVIKASVTEKDPIKVRVNGKKYTVVKKVELLPKMEGYEATTTKIKGFDIPALYNEITKVTLVGLKDETGNIKLFQYDSTNGKYSEYQELSFDMMNLYIHRDKNSRYKSIKLKINDQDVIGYEIEGIDDYCLLYATNTITGYEGYYLYDKKENSVQRYDTKMLEKLTKQKDKYLSIVLVLSSVCFLSMLFLLIEVNRDNKRKNEES